MTTDNSKSVTEAFALLQDAYTIINDLLNNYQIRDLHCDPHELLTRISEFQVSDDDVDTSDIPEVGKEWFEKAKLKFPGHDLYYITGETDDGENVSLFVSATAPQAALNSYYQFITIQEWTEVDHVEVRHVKHDPMLAGPLPWHDAVMTVGFGKFRGDGYSFEPSDD